MSTAIQSWLRHPPNGLPPLVNGDRMKQPEFHRAYETYPEDVKFELIGGIVYMASPLRRAHGRDHAFLGSFLESYAAETPGIELLDNATTILGEESEPQPDLTLRILSECGGQSNETAEDYVEGAPELVAEIALSTRAIDLHQKKEDYRQAGVQEYMVLSVEEPEFFWFHFRSRTSIAPDRAGIARSRVFPGLWIHIPALLAQRRKDLLAAIRKGLASPEHAAFVKRLDAKRRKRSP